MITHNPLHGSGRAALPHPALALGNDAHATQGIGMTDRRQWQPTVDEAPHAIPKNTAVLAAPRQRAIPEPPDLEPKDPQRVLVQGHSVVPDVSTHHRLQPLAHLGNGFMHASLKLGFRVVQLLALHQLMAIDLRFVLAISRINNDLERIGDQAVNIAQGATRILRHPRIKPYVDLPRMTELVEQMVRNALDAVVLRDVELAQKVLATDDQVDHYRDQVFRELLTYMMGDSSVVFPAFELILVAKNLERIGDHATNIAEDVIYLVQGQDIRHNVVDRR